jgi:histidine triad (HIT) family protein
MKATGATAYNILQNNGSAAHQAVFHVHFHIIPKFSKEGLGIGWYPSNLEAEAGRELAESIARAIEED